MNKKCVKKSLKHPEARANKRLLPNILLLLFSKQVMSDSFVTPRTLLSMGSPRQEYCSDLPFPSPRYLPDSEIEPTFPAWQVDSLPLSRLGSQIIYAAAAAKSLQLCPTLCDPIDGSPPGYPIPRILQARTLE